MAAGNSPKGDFVYKEPEQDVATESSPEELTQDQQVEAKEESPEDQLTEDDLKSLENKPIPYSRFKEVNEKQKSLMRSLEESKQSFEQQLKALTNQYEAKLAAERNVKQDDPYEYEDETSKQVRTMNDTIKSLQTEIKTLKSSAHKQSVSNKLDRLAKKYPNADKLAVQGWNVVLPDASLEELMEKSHHDNTTRVKNQLTEIINRKKEKAKTPLPTGPTRIRLKPDERPKSFAEATKMARKWFPDK